MRKLYYVPTIHFYNEVFDEPQTAQERSNKKLADKLASKLWKKAISMLDKQGMDPKNLIIFHDGVSSEDQNCEEILRVFAKEVKTTGKEYIIRLIDRGATAVKTEDQQLTDEYRWLWNEWYDNESNDIIMNKRDIYVAGSINAKLKGTGIAFMGASHKVLEYLDKDIKVVKIDPLNRLKE